MTYRLSKRSMKRLERVHPALKAVVVEAIQITSVDFTVLEGARTNKRQRKLVDSGASWTMKSMHLLQPDGYAHAVDLGAMVGNKVRWDWPLYHRVADAMKKSAHKLNTPIEWGGDWLKTPDGPHFQLPRNFKV